MTCDRWRDVILLETDGTVPPADRDDLRRHLADCPACRQYAEAVRSVVSALSVECVGPVPARLAHRLRRLAATVEVRPAWRRQVRYWAAAAAALLVAATLVLAFLDRRPDRVRPDDLRDLAGLEIERDLAEIARDI